MINLFSCFNLILFILCFKEFNASPWDYTVNGPDYWKTLYSTCSGNWQSPINIDTISAYFDRTLLPIVFNNYNITLDWNVTNNGFSTVLYPLKNSSSSDYPYVTGSNFESKYSVYEIIFHWGYNDYQGSEHRINNLKYPLEMQLIHQSSSTSYTVIAFLFEISDTDNTNLNDLLTAVSYNNGTTINFAINSIIANLDSLESQGYYRYHGSFTTPPCTEGITWTIYTTTLSISSNQLTIFRGTGVQANFRSIQIAYTRSIYTSIGSIPISGSIGLNNAKNNINYFFIINLIYLIFFYIY